MNFDLLPIPTIEKEKKPETLIENLKKLSSIESLSGQEEEMRKYLKASLESFGMKCNVDGKGNLWGYSEDEVQNKILLCAHMDKVGPAKEASVDGTQLTGRLDNALGLSIILQLVSQGLRPSIVFTVEEESEIEVVKNGEIITEERELKDNLYNAGARFAAQELAIKKDKPKLVIVVDTTQMGKVDNGPIIYTSSGLKEPGKQFYFPAEKLKNVAKIINQGKPGISYLEGNDNDSIEFTFVPDLGVLAVEIPIENNHSSKEEASIEDIKKAGEILKKIIINADKI